MAANIMLLAVLAMFVGWVIYFKIQDRKEENNNKNEFHMILCVEL